MTSPALRRFLLIACIALVWASAGSGGRLQAQDEFLPLTARLADSAVELTWNGDGTVESARRLSGPWTPLTVSSPQRVDLSDAGQYFRRVPPGGPPPPTTPDYGYDPTLPEQGEAALPAETPPPPVSATVNLSFLPPVGRQGTAASPGFPGSCAAWASTYGLATFTAAKRGNYSPTNTAQWASPAYIYIQVLQAKGAASNTCQGSQMTSYFTLLSAGGTPSLASAAYTPNCRKLWSDYADQQVPPDPAFTVTGIRTVETTTLPAIRRILAANGVLSYGTSLYTDWSGYRGDPVPYVGNGVISTNSNGTPVGHCMMIIGYDDTRQALLIQNSEGPDWGGTVSGAPPNPDGTDAGYVWMAYTTFTRLAQGRAFYVH